MKMLILFLTITVVYAGVPAKVPTMTVIYQPSVVDALDPSRARLA